MASSKVVSTNPDLPRDSSISSSLSNFLLSDLPPNTMDDLLKSIYTPPPPPPPHPLKDTKPSTTTLDDVWNHIVAGTSHRPSSDDAAAGGREGMTLEDFLTKAGAVREEDVRGVMPSSLTPHHYPLPPPPPPSSDAPPSLQPSTPAAKGKRRVVEEPLDKATLQKQRRMIKNRESAARSRERKQAYTSELESLVQQLEEENARLLNEEAEREKQRLKQLREFVIPIEEKPKPKRRLRRSSSAQTL